MHYLGVWFDIFRFCLAPLPSRHRIGPEATKKKKIRRRKEKKGKKKTVSFRQLAVSQPLSLTGLVISQLGKNDTDPMEAFQHHAS
jgi:hypothetical protein